MTLAHCLQGIPAKQIMTVNHNDHNKCHRSVCGLDDIAGLYHQTMTFEVQHHTACQHEQEGGHQDAVIPFSVRFHFHNSTIWSYGKYKVLSGLCPSTKRAFSEKKNLTYKIIT